MENSTLTAPAISCGHCRRTVEAAVGVLPGVEGVRVPVATKQVAMRFDPAQPSRERIEAAPAVHQYDRRSASQRREDQWRP